MQSRLPLQIVINRIVQNSRADDIRPTAYILLITLSEARLTPQSRLRRAGAPTGEPVDGVIFVRLVPPLQCEIRESIKNPGGQRPSGLSFVQLPNC